MSPKTKLQRQILVTAYENRHLSQAEIARRLDCSPSYVSQVLNRYNSYDAMEARIEELNHQLGFSDGGSRWGLDAPARDGRPAQSNDPIEADLQGLDESLEDLGPIGALLIAVVLGVALLSTQPLSGSTSIVVWGLLTICVFVVGAVVVAFYSRCQKEGVAAATSWLIGHNDEKESSTTSTQQDANEKTPPAPESLKNDLIFDRADLECEWCGNHVDQPEVHHIEPRSDGGPNTPSNLIVLCPNCHRKADDGGISKSKLKAKVRRQMA